LLSRIVPSKFAGRKIVLVDELLDNGTPFSTTILAAKFDVSVLTLCRLFACFPVAGLWLF
jgi:hypothetical protein